MKTYKLGRMICLILAISICLREKYLAKIRMTTILSGSTGSMEKNPKSNQLAAPLTVCPKTSRAAKKKLIKTKKPASSSDLRKKRKQKKKKRERFPNGQKNPQKKARKEKKKKNFLPPQKTSLENYTLFWTFLLGVF